MTVGPWKPIRLEVADYTLDVEISPVAGQTLALSSSCRVKPSPVDVELVTVLRTKKGEVLDEHRVTATEEVKTDFDVSKASLWWPVGYGDQSLYEVEHRLEKKVRCRRTLLTTGCHACSTQANGRLSGCSNRPGAPG